MPPELLELLDTMPVPVCIQRVSDARIAYANLALVALANASGPHDLIGQGTARFVHPDDAIRAGENLRAIGDGQRFSPADRYRFVGVDGSEGIVEAYSVRIDWRGESHVLTVMVDVAARVEAQREREAADQRYRALVEAAPDGIAVQADGRYVYVNPEFMRMMGASSPAELVGKEITETIAAEDHGRSADSIRNTLRNGASPELVEYRMVALDGHVFPAEVTGRRVEFGGRPATQAFFRLVSGEDRRAEIARMRSATGTLVDATEALVSGDDGPLTDAQSARAEEIAGWARHLRSLVEAMED